LLNKGLGIYLTVHNHSELIFTLPSGLGAHTGIRTYVVINRELTNKLDGSRQERQIAI